jgi:AraC-like DNA-binding protein
MVDAIMNDRPQSLAIRQLRELSELTARHSATDGVAPTAIDGVSCIRLSAPDMTLPAVYFPSVCVILRGRKQVLLGDEIYRYAPTQFLAVSVDLPLIGQVTEASAQRPYLCLQIALDARQIGELIAQSDTSQWTAADSGRGIFVGDVDRDTLDAAHRLLRLLDAPRDIAVLAPMALREIHYRLLNGAYGAAIAQIAIAGSNMQRIGQTIRRIKSNLAQPVRVEELAAMVNMSASSFHQHFKSITAMSPLQYQKRLRLTEARRLLLAEASDATSVAYRVGYESPSQFSREYARLFGAPPMRDIASIRESKRIPA